MPTMNTIVETVREAQSDTQKTASSQEGPEKNSMSKEAEILDGVIGENQLEKMAEDEISKAAEYAEKGREMLRQEVRKVAEERKQIADEHGEEKLADLDKAAAAEEYGRKLAQNEVQASLEKTAVPGGQYLADAGQALKGYANQVGQGLQAAPGQAAGAVGRGARAADQAVEGVVDSGLRGIANRIPGSSPGMAHASETIRNASPEVMQALRLGGLSAGSFGAGYGVNELGKESSFEKVAEEYGEKTAQDLSKAAHFDQAGRELAHLAVNSGLEKNAAPNPSQIAQKAKSLLQQAGQKAKDIPGVEQGIEYGSKGVNMADQGLQGLGSKARNAMANVRGSADDTMEAARRAAYRRNSPAVDRRVGAGVAGAGGLGLGAGAYGASQLAKESEAQESELEKDAMPGQQILSKYLGQPVQSLGQGVGRQLANVPYGNKVTQAAGSLQRVGGPEAATTLGAGAIGTGGLGLGGAAYGANQLAQ